MEKLEYINLLVLGSGGREHSLCYNLIKSKKVSYGKLKAFDKKILMAEVLLECSKVDGKVAQQELNQIKKKNLKSVICGKALYEKRVSVQNAIGILEKNIEC